MFPGINPQGGPGGGIATPTVLDAQSSLLQQNKIPALLAVQERGKRDSRWLVSKVDNMNSKLIFAHVMGFADV